jgi:hypothetical protein
MNKTTNNIGHVSNSPWIDAKLQNLFRREFSLIDDLKIESHLEEIDAYFKPIEIYRWIDNHQGKSLFFKGLARFAPMFPVRAYNGQIASWISPPPSGFGNAIYIVVGHDKTGDLRLVGGNFFSEPRRQVGSSLTDEEFFNQYDSLDDRTKQHLVYETIAMSIQEQDEALVSQIRRECEHFHTMGIYLTVLDGGNTMFHAAKAVVEGEYPADFSYEYFGEVK